MKRGRAAWLEDLAIVAIVVTLGLVLAFTAHGEEPLQANEDSAKIIADLQRRLAELQKSKGCGKVEVTEPPRNFVPNKERGS